MKRALVLNAGAAWAAYQIGALRHLVGDRKLRFDLCAGTGIGAMNAAFVACNAFEALESFWKRIGWRKLVSINWRTPWREGPCVGTPQRQFIGAHVSEQRLAELGVQLVFSCLNLQTGREEIMRYPGGAIPLIEALMGAVALPGLCPPLQNGDAQLVEATLVNGFILRQILQMPVEEIFAVAAAPTRSETTPQPRYKNWRAIMQRVLKINQAHDVWSALAAADKLTAAAASYRHVSKQLPELLSSRVADPAMQTQLRQRLEKIYAQSAFPMKREAGPVVRAITPSQEIDYSMSRFRWKDLSAAMDLGYRDAQKTLSAPSCT